MTGNLLRLALAGHHGYAPRKRAWFALVVGAFVSYAALYILRTSFVIDGTRYFTLADDQMISMKYAENFAAGHGLVWNAGGERVEGYTNFLWVLYMAVFHWAKVPRPIISACVQISGAVLLLANLVVVRALTLRLFGSERVAVVAAALTAFYVPLDNWAFQGTEVSILTLLVTCAVWLTIRAFDSDHVPWRLFLLLGSTTLIRPDMIVLCGIVLIALAASPSRRRVYTVTIGAVIVTTFVAAETIFRLAYFGDPLPNTYYLKVAGPWLPRISRGGFVTLLFLVQILPLVMVMLVERPFQTARREVALLLAIFASQLLYSALVGGDAWEWWGGSNRFVSIAVPLLMICASAALVALWDGLCRAARHDIGIRLGRWTRMAAAITTIGVLIGVNYLALSQTGNGLAPLARLFLIVKPYETETDEKNVRAALALSEFTRPEAVVGVVWAGAIPYFSQRVSIDLLGKMDRRIARGPWHLPPRGHMWTGFYPGHMKWDYSYSIDQLKPDVLQAPLWQLNGAEEPPMPGLERNYKKHAFGSSWYLRKDSPHIRWNVLVSGVGSRDPRETLAGTGSF